MKWIKRIALALLAVLIVATLGFVVWAETPLGPAPEALAALESDSQVEVKVTRDFIAFAPVGSAPSTGFVFYPGGRVDYRSYAVPLREIASRGYLVVLLPVRLNLAIFDVGAADPVFAAYPEIQRWALGGHSLGGAVAAMYAKENPAKAEAIIFWASYPADDSLKESGLKFLTIYGTRDMAGTEIFKEKRAALPSDAEYVVIEGGNHAQFGDYGDQPGDNPAAISRQEQQRQTVEAVVEFLSRLR